MVQKILLVFVALLFKLIFDEYSRLVRRRVLYLETQKASLQTYRKNPAIQPGTAEYASWLAESNWHAGNAPAIERFNRKIECWEWSSLVFYLILTLFCLFCCYFCPRDQVGSSINTSVNPSKPLLQSPTNSQANRRQ